MSMDMSKELIEMLRYLANRPPYSGAADIMLSAADALEAKAAPVGERDSHWFSLVMNCASELETASYCMTDESAKRIAQSCADYYRKQAGAAHQRQQAREGVAVPHDLLIRVLEPVTSEQYINSKHELLALMDEFARLNKGAGSHE